MQNKLYINGQWVSPVKGGTFAAINPATEEIIHQVPTGTAEDIDLAVRAARNAFDDGPWPRMPGAQRAGYLRKIAEGIRNRLEELSILEVKDNGKPLPEARWDVGDAAACFDFYAGLAEQLDEKMSESIALPDDRFVSSVRKEPLGVAGAIIPWNYPLLMAAWKVAPALAAGCTMVLKPSELTSLTALELASIAQQAGLPAGVLNIVTGFGADAGAALTSHSGVDKLAFTGSLLTGSKIMGTAARDIKKISLELGGKSPFVIFDDADIDKAVEWIMFGIFWNQGQVCSATSRVLVHESIYQKLLQKLIQEAEKIAVGNGMDEGTLLGPIVSRDQMNKILHAIGNACAAGARVATGGTQVTTLSAGYFIKPTILVDVPLTCDAWREEIFGPVVCIHPFGTEQEALQLANDSRYGLAAAVMSADQERCNRVAAQFRAGIVWINCSQPTFCEAPWGGYKSSGIGRELGRWGLENYLETKQITQYVSDKPWGWYIK